MSSILFLSSSPRPGSLSTKVATELVELLTAKEAGSTVVHRDLTANPLPHIDRGFAVGHRKTNDDLDDVEKAALQLSDTLLNELMAADTLVISSGFINFNITSNLKAWLDHVVRVGKTFQYTAQGPQGLTSGKKAYVVLASGGVYSEGPLTELDHATPYLQWMLRFMGIKDIEIIRVEGVSKGPEGPANAVAGARAQIAQLVA